MLTAHAYTSALCITSLCGYWLSIHVRSAERNLLHVPRSHRLDTYGRRAFVIAGRSAWNSLPDTVHNPNSTEAAFRRLLNIFVHTVVTVLAHLAH